MEREREQNGIRNGDNHQKCQQAHSEIVCGRQGLEQAQTLARRLHKKMTRFTSSHSFFRGLYLIVYS